MKLLLFYSLSLCLLLTTGCEEESAGLPADVPFGSLRDGDLAFRRGTGIVSQAVIAADKAGTYSHIGILIRKDSTWNVIHAVPGEPDHKGDPDRVKMEKLTTFWSKERAKTGAVMRPAVDPALCRRAACHALRLHQTGIRFDHHYNLKDTSQMYCTELIDHVYRSQGIDLPEGRISRVNVPGMSGDYLLPGDIQQSNLLGMLYNF